MRSRAANVSIQKILSAISRRSYIQVEVLTGRKRNKIIMPWRQLAYLLSYELTGCTLTQIGKVLGRDHTSLLHGIKQINKLREQDPYVEQIYQELHNELS
ncbi:MAG: helix-turn-helix domain-containing protein [Paracoccaceae bacterium]